MSIEMEIPGGASRQATHGPGLELLNPEITKIAALAYKIKANAISGGYAGVNEIARNYLHPDKPVDVRSAALRNLTGIVLYCGKGAPEHIIKAVRGDGPRTKKEDELDNNAIEKASTAVKFISDVMASPADPLRFEALDALSHLPFNVDNKVMGKVFTRVRSVLILEEGSMKDKLVGFLEGIVRQEKSGYVDGQAKLILGDLRAGKLRLR